MHLFFVPRDARRPPRLPSPHTDLIQQDDTDTNNGRRCRSSTEKRERKLCKQETPVLLFLVPSSSFHSVSACMCFLLSLRVTGTGVRVLAFILCTYDCYTRLQRPKFSFPPLRKTLPFFLDVVPLSLSLSHGKAFFFPPLSPPRSLSPASSSSAAPSC